MSRKIVMEQDAISVVSTRDDSGERHIEVARRAGDIDMDNLTREVAEAGGYALWWAHLKVAADASVERLDLALDTLSAEKAKAFRMNNLGSKITEAMVAEHLALDKDVLAAKEALIVAREKAALLRSVYDVAQQKSRTLQNLTFLIGAEHGANYNPLRERMKEDARRDRASRRPV